MRDASSTTGAAAPVGLDRAQILRLIPQQGAMCLLERIIDWDAQRLLAQGSDPRTPEHPLRAHDRLGSASALEYAAQAAAAHGALLGALPQSAQASRSAPTALLASGRAVELLCLRLDQLAAELLIEVRRQHADGGGALYDFELRAGATLARGRLTLLLS
jgi:predicted hotdog family 3-hydroxylacyl-ACP dehydratase